MPVILENGKDQIRTWLDPKRSQWSKELQSLLKPFAGELECYPVDKAVGKVGNNSPAFIVPVASTENKKNIANFFSNAQKFAKGDAEKKEMKAEENEAKNVGRDVKRERDEQRATKEQSGTEDNAPLPCPSPIHEKAGLKRKHETINPSEEPDADTKIARTDAGKAYRPSMALSTTGTPEKAGGRQIKSGTSNGTKKGSPTKAGDGSQRITNFFNK